MLCKPFFKTKIEFIYFFILLFFHFFWGLRIYLVMYVLKLLTFLILLQPEEKSPFFSLAVLKTFLCFFAVCPKVSITTTGDCSKEDLRYAQKPTRYVFRYFYQPYLVLFTVAPRNGGPKLNPFTTVGCERRRLAARSHAVMGFFVPLVVLRPSCAYWLEKKS